MKEITIDRLYQNMFDIRNYIVIKCYTEKTNIKVTLKGYPGHMILNWSELQDKTIRVSKKIYKSKFDKKEYKLVSFL